MARKTMQKWIEEAMVDRDKPGPISAFALTHMLGSSKQEVHSVKIGDQAPSAKALADMFRDKADTYAQDLTGVQMFVVLAFYGQDAESSSAYPFKVNPVSVEEGGISTEAPTEAGMRSQSMRWADTFLTQVFKRQAQLDDFAAKTLNEVQEQNIKLMRENYQAFDIVKQLLSERADRTHAYRIEEIKDQRNADVLRKLLGMAPSLINTVTNRNVFPASTEDTALIEALADNIDPEMLSMLPNFMPPEIAGPLQSRFARHIEAKKKAEAAADTSALPPYRGNAEEELGGDNEK